MEQKNQNKHEKISVFDRFKRRYWKDESGTPALIFALVLPILITSTAAVVDIGQGFLVKQRLQNALDASALAAASSSVANEQELNERFKAFFAANYQDAKLGDVFDLEINLIGDEVHASAKAKLDTAFLKYLGRLSLEVEADTTVRREVRGIEAVLVLDVTGSMQSQMGNLRKASKQFINTIYSRVSDPQYVKVGMVPYSVVVNVGSIAPDIVSLPVVPSRPTVDYDLEDDTEWQGCVMARPYPHDTLDTSISEGGYWKAFWWEHTEGDEKNNFWDETKDEDASLNLDYKQCNNRRTPNLACPLSNPIIPLTSDQAKLLQAAEDLVYWCRGGTLGNLGMTWAWRVLSPEPPFTEGAAYDNFYWRKAVVMMTDGQNQLWKKGGIETKSDYSPYGYIEEGTLGTTSRNTGLRIVNDRFAETCEAMKEKGITIYTITFGNSINDDTEELYRDCATDESKYFDAPGGNELVSAFEQISKELSNLHIKD